MEGLNCNIHPSNTIIMSCSSSFYVDTYAPRIAQLSTTPAKKIFFFEMLQKTFLAKTFDFC